MKTIALLALATFGVATASAEPVLRSAPSKDGGYSFSTTMTLGGPDADDDTYFYERFGSVEVAADAEGHLHVLDNGNIRIQVFDAQGNLARSIGAEGDGPGEFRIPSRLSVNASGQIAVFDMGQGRVSVLDADGKLLRDQMVMGSPDALVLADDGRVFLSYGTHGPAKVQVFGADGELAWEGGKLGPMGGRHIKMEIGRQTVAPRLVVVDGGSAFRAPEGDYLLERFRSDGIAAFARPFERRKFTEEELAPPASEEEGGVEHVVIVRRDGGGGEGGGGGGGASAWTDDSGEEMSMHLDADELKQFLPTHHSATRGVLAWPDGRLWVLTSEGKHGRVDEWSMDGEWLRRFDLPDSYDWLTVGRDGRLYGVTHDEDEYPFVHRIEVAPDA